MTNGENIVSFPDRRVIEEEAAMWVAKMDTRDLIAAERQEFRNWLQKSPQHQEAIDRMAAIWSGSDILDDLNYEDTLEPAITGRQPQSRLIVWGMAVAASLLLAVTALLFNTSNPQAETGSSHYYTAVGELKTVTLVDGSSATLNTNSEIEVHYTPDTRTLELIRGEAHFKVAHDTSRPFLVYAGGSVVKAVGTAFSVFLREKNIEVTVDEGVVELLSAPETAQPINEKKGIPPAQNLTPIAALTVGQNAVFSTQIDHIEKLNQQTLDRKLLWREGFIAFAGEPLSEVIDNISRYTDVQIEIQDPSLKNTPIGGYFKVGDVDGMLEALENVFGVQVNRLDDKNITLTRAT
ncbi:FecR family protein [Kordiimonas pumila]|uniref:FecR family protein n=1 Tax=Kordiimonas pumila TaxID=2161677 RepID=A0ABV7D5W1_9PROT|nr:FecR family protein [Kordiimonas pumila]